MARRGGARAAPALLAAAALLVLATTPARAGAAEATCVWSSCTSNPLKGCGQLNTPTVSYEKKEAKGCACQRVNRWLCLPGRTQLCCPVAKDPAECDWYDVDCNWENLKEDVDDTSSSSPASSRGRFCADDADGDPPAPAPPPP